MVESKLLRLAAITVFASLVAALALLFALIELDAPMPITECIGPACLPSDSDRAGSECIITGWGTVSSSGPLPDTLQEAAVTVLNDTACAKAYAKQNDTATWFWMFHGFLCWGLEDCMETSWEMTLLKVVLEK